MEFIAYQIIYFLGTAFIVYPYKINKKILFIVYFVASLFLSLSIRENSIIENNSSDMMGYIQYMSGENEGEDYFIREFIFWWSIKFIYSIFKSSKYTLVFFDLICFFILYKSVENIRNSFSNSILKNAFNYNFIIYGFIIFFPTIIGMHTSYRQFIATILFIYSYSLLVSNKTFLFFIFLFISIFTHNISILFIPLLFIAKFNKPRYVTGFIVGFVFLFTMYIIRDGQNLLYRAYSEDMGALNVLVYYFIAILLLLIYSLVIKFWWLAGSIILIILYFIISYFIFGSSSSQRVILFSFSFLYPLIWLIISSLYNSKFLNLLLYNLTLLPIYFIFKSSIIYN
jgi:hypothetical protein